MRRILFAALALMLCLSGCAGQRLDSPAEHVYSHRGASGEETEHTFDAYDLALLYGSRYLEQDIVVSADGTLYVSHDATPQRLAGCETPFAELTDAEIDALETEDGHHFLRLRDVFDRYRDREVTFVVELKSEQAALGAFAALVEEYDAAGRIIVQCYDRSVLEALEGRYPDMPKLLLCRDQADFTDALTLDYVDILSVNKQYMTQENLDTAHAAGKQFNVWTLNTMSELEQAIGMGVDSYFTNFTAKALLLEKQYRSQ